MFLVTILKHKPNGKGLDIAQLRKCSALYTSFYVNLPTEGLIDLFLTLKIVSDGYVGLLFEFDHAQPPANELQELLVFLSEYNKEVDENSKHFTTLDVRDMIKEFSSYDVNNDAVLSYSEFKWFVRDYSITEDILDNTGTPELKSVAKLYHLAQTEPTGNGAHFNHDENFSMTTDTFFYLKFYLRFVQNKEDGIKEMTTKTSNDMANENVGKTYVQSSYNGRAMEETKVQGNNYGRATVETNKYARLEEKYSGIYERVYQSFGGIVGKSDVQSNNNNNKAMIQINPWDYNYGFENTGKTKKERKYLSDRQKLLGW
ncbi:uncharacterized protein LOC126836851 [Adelges cooleyi]|uniref:uncharacterized protein LOC126836851 n=1 Tax=Adelges cooleyi TaxID=133065 RepID=UPI00217FBAB3|nr:uncharacterized protein LOC126836851 [Adelges cooleyi]